MAQVSWAYVTPVSHQTFAVTLFVDFVVVVGTEVAKMECSDPVSSTSDCDIWK